MLTKYLMGPTTTPFTTTILYILQFVFSQSQFMGVHQRDFQFQLKFQEKQPKPTKSTNCHNGGQSGKGTRVKKDELSFF